MNIQGLAFFSLVISLSAILLGDFTSTMVNSYNLSSEDLTELETISNLTSTVEDAQNTLNATTPSSTTMLGFDLGGIWTTITRFLETPSILSSVIAGIANLFGAQVQVSAISSVVNIIGLILAFGLLFGLINFVRSGKEI